MVEFRSKSFFLRGGSLLLLFQGLQERPPWCGHGETFHVHVIQMELSELVMEASFANPERTKQGPLL